MYTYMCIYILYIISKGRGYRFVQNLRNINLIIILYVPVVPNLNILLSLVHQEAAYFIATNLFSVHLALFIVRVISLLSPGKINKVLNQDPYNSYISLYLKFI